MSATDLPMCPRCGRLPLAYADVCGEPDCPAFSTPGEAQAEHFPLTTDGARVVIVGEATHTDPRPRVSLPEAIRRARGGDAPPSFP